MYLLSWLLCDIFLPKSHLAISASLLTERFFAENESSSNEALLSAQASRLLNYWITHGDSKQ